jgi:hypothetical protein
MAATYQKIPGVGTGRLGLQALVRNRLYQGPDHLLVIQSTGYAEEYRRIFYRDVRYIDIRKSPSQAWQALVSGLFIAFFGLMLFVMPWVVDAVLMAPFVVWFLVNLALGPTVACYVHTHVQSLRVPAPRRRPKVAPFVAFLRERTGAPEGQPAPAATA